jgi:hypothetical protein
MVEMIDVSAEWGLLLHNSSQRHEHCVHEREPKNGERGRHLPAGVDTERPEHESEEHCTRITHHNLVWRQIEESAASGCSCEEKGNQRDFRLVHAITECKKSECGCTDDREDAHLPRYAVEPIEGVRGEDDPEDGEDT